MPFQSVTRQVTYTDASGVQKTMDAVTVPATGLGRDTNGGNGIRARLLGAAQTDTYGMRLWVQFYPTILGYGPYNGGVGGATYNNTFVQFDDCVDLWWNPVSWFKIDLGKFVDDTLRGKISDDSWMDGVTLISMDADEIFSRFQGQGMFGNRTSVTGVLATFKFGGLGVYALFPSLNPFSSAAYRNNYGNNITAGDRANVYEAANWNDGQNEFKRQYSRSQIALSYAIPNIGLVRAQYVGAVKAKGNLPATPVPAYQANLSNGTTTTAPGSFNNAPTAFSWATTPRFEAAFLLNGIQNLTVDIGGKVPLPVKGNDVQQWNYVDPATGDQVYMWQDPYVNDPSTWQNPYQVSVGAKYFMLDNNALTLWARVDGKFGGTYDPGTTGSKVVNFGPEINLHINPSYNLGICIVGLDLGFGWYGETKSDGKVYGKNDALKIDGYNGGVRFGAGLYGQKNFNAAGSCYIRGGLAYSAGTKVNGIQEDAVFSIPINMGYTF